MDYNDHSFKIPLGQMSETDFKLFQKLIYTKTGINMTDKKVTLLSNRIRKRLKALKFDSYNKYYQHIKDLKVNDDEFINMVNVVTTNVTHFFRNPKQFDKFKNELLSEISKTHQTKKNIRILSAGCSSGEEPYTIAIVLLDFFQGIFPSWHLEVEGVDISTSVIESAKEGIYKKEKMKEMSEGLIKKYFTSIDNDQLKIRDVVKKITKFRRFNLKDDNFSGKYDVIFCRNVVIYFDSETKHRIYNKIHHAIKDNGFFLIGHSEGVFNDNRFKYISPGIYRKI